MIQWNLTEEAIGELVETLDGQEWAKAKMDAMSVLKAQNQEMTDDAIVQLALNAKLDGIFADGVKKFSLVPMTKPKIDIKKITADSITVGLMFAIKPEVKLGDIRGIRYKVADVEVTDADMEDGIRVYRESKAQMVDKNGPAELGDTVVIDYVGTMDGKEFEYGSEEDAVILLGSNMFIPGFENEIVGKCAGTELEFPVTFPEDYGVEDLNGKDVVFKVTVKKVQKQVIPEVNDDFVKTLKIEGVVNVEDFKSHVRKTVAKAMRLRNEQEAENKLMDDLLAVTEVNVPGPIVETEVGTMVQKMNADLASQGATLVSYLEMKGQTPEEFIKSLWPSAERNVKVSLALEEVAAANKLYPSNSEIEAEYKVMAMRYQMDVAKVKQAVPADQLSYQVLLNKALDYLKNLGKKRPGGPILFG